MTTNKIGIVIPCFNSERSLARAVRSVVNQTFSNWQLLIIDDASDLPQEECIQEFLSDPRIEVIRLKSNQGAAAARTAGVQALETTWIAFLDSDDEWLPDKLLLQLAFIDRSEENISLCVTAFDYYRNEGTLGTYRYPSPGASYKRLLFGCDMSPGSTLLMRKSLFQKYGYFDTSMRRFEDWDWLLRCMLGGEKVFSSPHGRSRVYNTSWPSFTAVKKSALQMCQRHLSAIWNQSKRDALKFVSSLLLETAVAAYRSKRFLLAPVLGTASVLIWPFRNITFYLRLLTRLFHLLSNHKPSSISASPKPTILHVISGLKVGGAERMLTELVTEFEQQGIRQYVVSLQPGGKYSKDIQRILGERFIECNLWGYKDVMPTILTIRRILNHSNITVVQGWMYHGDLFSTLGYLASLRWFSVNLFWGIRCSELKIALYSKQLRYVVALCKFLSPIPHAITSNSSVGINSHHKTGYINPRFLLVQNCVNAIIFAPNEAGRKAVRQSLGIPQDTFVFITVARNDPMKGFDDFLHVAAAMPKAVAIAVGKGTEELKGTKNVICMGLRSDISSLLSAADALLSPSLFGEGQSNSILEAMATGLPIVATDIGDSAEIVSDGGYVVLPGKTDKMVKALNELAKDKQYAKKIGERGRARVVSRYTRKAMADMYLNVYQA